MAQTAKKVQQYKVDAVTKLKEQFAAAPDLIFSDFRGLTFPQMTDLRAKLTEKRTAYRVVRNTFARIAMKEAGLPDASPWLEGPTALAFLGKDPSPAAKVMIDFTKAAPLTIKGGVIERQALQLQGHRGALQAARTPGAPGHAHGHDERAPAQHDVRDERRGVQARAHAGGGCRQEGKGSTLADTSLLKLSQLVRSKNPHEGEDKWQH